MYPALLKSGGDFCQGKARCSELASLGNNILLALVRYEGSVLQVETVGSATPDVLAFCLFEPHGKAGELADMPISDDAVNLGMA